MFPLLILVFLVGVIGALLGALLGVGGGIVMVPAFVKLGLSMQQAIATSLAVIIVTAVTSSWRYAREGWIRWDVAAAAAVGALLAAVLGTEIMKRQDASQLKMLFGIFLIAVGIYMLLTAKSQTV